MDLNEVLEEVKNYEGVQEHKVDYDLSIRKRYELVCQKLSLLCKDVEMLCQIYDLYVDKGLYLPYKKKNGGYLHNGYQEPLRYNNVFYFDIKGEIHNVGFYNSSEYIFDKKQVDGICINDILVNENDLLLEKIDKSVILFRNGSYIIGKDLQDLELITELELKVRQIEEFMEMFPRYISYTLSISKSSSLSSWLLKKNDDD